MAFQQGLNYVPRQKQSSGAEVLKCLTKKNWTQLYNPTICTMNHLKFTAANQIQEIITIRRVEKENEQGVVYTAEETKTKILSAFSHLV